MANEKKAVCGGFLIGDGLQMDGKVLSVESASGGNIRYVECYIESDISDIQCELTPAEIKALYDDGVTLFLRVNRGSLVSSILACSGVVQAVNSITFSSVNCAPAGSNITISTTIVSMNYNVNVIEAIQFSKTI